MLNDPISAKTAGVYPKPPKVLAIAGFIGILGLITQLPSFAQNSVFSPGNLIVSRSQYQGTAATVTIGQTLPPVCGTSASCTGTATDSGAFPANGVNKSDGTLQNVWNNDGPDGSFGVTSPIFLDQISTGGTFINTLPIDATKLVTSFSSKSELALNLSSDGSAITFMGYSLGSANTKSLINNLDVSNSNTPGVIDPTNPAGSAFYRAVAQINSLGTFTFTDTNAYSGNNGRAALLVNGLYYTVGNSNNGTANPTNVTRSTGLDVVTPGSAPGTPVMVDPTLVTHSGDKAGKDSNFRGIAYNGTNLFITKGSGSNGIDTVYEVNAGGALPTIATAATSTIAVAPGFPTARAKTAGIDNIYPFAMWFATPTTLYVADEGDGVIADAPNSPYAGLQKWVFNGTTWSLAYVMQNGLNLGVKYSDPSYPISLNPAPAGLRNLTGRVNSDGSVTLWAITATVSANGDQGADPNQLVTINDNLANTSAAAAQYEKFSLVETAPYGNVLRGVSFTPGTALGTTTDAAISLTVNNTTLTYPGTTQTKVCIAPATNTSATGVIQILDGTTPLTTQPLEGSGCSHWYISPGLSAGVHSLTAFYSGDSNNPSGTSAVVTVTVDPAQSYLSANCGGASFTYGRSYSCNVNIGSGAGAVIGNITYVLDGGTPVVVALTNGNAQFTLTTPAPGAHSVVIGYAAQGNFTAASSSTQNFNVSQATTQVQLTPSNYFPPAGSPLTLTATVSSYSDGTVTTGLVTFYDNGTALGSPGAVNGAGQASLVIPSLAAGSHSYTAKYGGVTDFAPGSSNYVSISAH